MEKGSQGEALSSLVSLGSSSPYPSLQVPPLFTSLPTPLPRASPEALPSPLCESRLLGNVSGRACAGDTMKARDQVGREGNKGSAFASGPTVRRSSLLTPSPAPPPANLLLTVSAPFLQSYLMLPPRCVLTFIHGGPLF